MSAEETRLWVVALIMFVSYAALVFQGRYRSQSRRKQ